MDSPYQGSRDVHVLPTNLALPGVGVLPVNAYVVLAEEPVLIDSGIGFDREEFIEALSSVVDPAALRWVWLTHDDADHTGSIERVMALAPNARLVTNAFCALRMATWWHVPLDRVHAIRVGETIQVGDRTLRAVAPPLFDNPLSIGVLDESTGALFSVDAFGAILPEPTEDLGVVPPEALAGGMLGWATSIHRGPISSTTLGSVRYCNGCAACTRPASSPPTCLRRAVRPWTTSWRCCERFLRPSRSSHRVTKSSGISSRR